MPERAVGRRLRLLTSFRREELQHTVDYLLGRRCVPVADSRNRLHLAFDADVRIVFVGDLGIGAEDGEQNGLGNASLRAEAREAVPERVEAINGENESVSCSVVSDSL